MADSGVTVFLDESGSLPVRGFLHSPGSPTGNGVVLTHGAGADCQSPLLVALAAALADPGLAVLRFNLPFRQMRPHGPPSPGSAARDRDGIRAAVTAIKKIVPGRVFGGGHSYGGRQVTMLAALEPDLFVALLLLSYPLHPPRRPEQMRTAHFPQLRTPSFFAQGERDPFASVAEITSALKLIPARTRLLAIEGGNHSLARRGEVSRLAAKVAHDFCEFVG